MDAISLTAVYFVVWWITLFAVLPFSLKTQDEAGETIPGTESSAPQGSHMLRAVIRTTVVSLVLFGAFLFATRVLGFRIEDIPTFMPSFQ